MELLRRFLQHVLLSGFMKVRHFGFMSPNCSLNIGETRQLVSQQIGGIFQQPAAKPDHPLGPHCPDCGGELVFLKSILPFHRERCDSG